MEQLPLSLAHLVAGGWLWRIDTHTFSTLLELQRKTESQLRSRDSDTVGSPFRDRNVYFRRLVSGFDQNLSARLFLPSISALGRFEV